MGDKELMDLISFLVEKKGVPNPISFVKKSVKELSKKRLNQHILSCDDCDRQCDRKSISYGNPNASLLIIGDVQSLDNKTDKPFTDDEYKYLKIALDYFNFDYNDVFFINSVNCNSVMKNSKGELIEMIPNIDQIKKCKPFTDFAINIVDPVAIILLGSAPVHSYLAHKGTAVSLRGKWEDIKGIPSMITYSPRYLESRRISNDENTEKYRYEFLEDFKKVVNYINSQRHSTMNECLK